MEFLLISMLQLVQIALACSQYSYGTPEYVSKICTQPAYTDYQYSLYDPYNTGSYAYYQPAAYYDGGDQYYHYPVSENYYPYYTQEPDYYRENYGLEYSAYYGNCDKCNKPTKCDRKCNKQTECRSQQSDCESRCFHRDSDCCSCGNRKINNCKNKNNNCNSDCSRVKCICICDEIRSDCECDYRSYKFDDCSRCSDYEVSKCSRNCGKCGC